MGTDNYTENIRITLCRNKIRLNAVEWLEKY